MELSIFLAKLMGLYLVIVGAAALCQRKRLEKLVGLLADNEGWLFLSGSIFLILGLAVVISHNIWVSDWRGLITMLGWLTVIKASLRLFWPQKIKPLAMKFMKIWTWVCVGFLVMGVYLVYVGFGV